jgi:hypothetical protein
MQRNTDFRQRLDFVPSIYCVPTATNDTEGSMLSNPRIAVAAVALLGVLPEVQAGRHFGGTFSMDPATKSPGRSEMMSRGVPT